MTIAEMPGDPDQMVRVVAANFSQRLRCGDNLDQPAVVEYQRVASPKRNRVFEIEQKRKAVRTGHCHPPPMPIVETKDDGIGWRLAPAMLPAHFGRPDHIQ
jgi:hypothetical protein